MEQADLKKHLSQTKSLFDGQVWLTEDEEYKIKKKVFNRAVNATPLAIIEVANNDDICKAIELALRHNVQLSVNGGGHSAGGSCMLNDGLVLNMSKLDNVLVDPVNFLAKVGAGIRNYQLDKATTAYNQAVPLGTCPDVGVIGSCLGGGIGYLSRAFGLTCDSVESFTLVTAESNILTVDMNNNPDLFWALRGGGGCQIGVVVDATFRTLPIPKLLYGGLIEWPLAKAKEVLKYYNEFVSSPSKQHFLYAYISHANKQEAKISVMGFSLARETESQRFFTQVANWCPGAMVEVGIKTYLDIQSNHYEDGLAFDWKNGFIEGELSPECISDLLSCFEQCPDNSGGIMLDPMGGRISESAIANTAFVHRNANYVCSITGLSNNTVINEQINQWVTNSHAVMAKHYNGNSYQNYEDLSENEVYRYFGQHKSRLMKIKRRYDPTNLFYGSLSREIKVD